MIYFTAPHRVDFRTLVSELARSLRARIDLRQIGSRDAARLVGGLGNCGRDLCCATFLKDFEPVSLRMAKVQDLPPNPLKISGACGRLMCCLKYEHPLYAEFARTAPAVGEQVALDEGDGVVVGHQVPADSVVIRMSASGATWQLFARGGLRCSPALRVPRHSGPGTAATAEARIGGAGPMTGELRSDHRGCAADVDLDRSAGRVAAA